VSVVLVDQDGVLADFEQALLKEMRRRHPGGPAIPAARRRIFSARQQYRDEHGAQWSRVVDTIIHDEGFYAGLPVIEGGPEALAQMRAAGHVVLLCTSPLTGSRWCVPEKLAWIERHLGPDWPRQTVITPDKTLVGDHRQPCVLIDDRPAISGAASPPPWTQVFFAAAYNKDAEGPWLARWADWRDVVEPALARQGR
jgi:5'-nucleotidase